MFRLSILHEGKAVCLLPRQENPCGTFLRRGGESNSRVEVLQTTALPLGYHAFNLVVTLGLSYTILVVPARQFFGGCAHPHRSLPQAREVPLNVRGL